MNEETKRKISRTMAWHRQKNHFGWKPRITIDFALYAPIFNSARKNAAKRGIPFELTIEDFNKLVIRSGEKCEVSGLKFNFGTKGYGKRRPFAASLDRIKSTKGYTRSNCRLVSVIANCALNEWGDATLLKFCAAVVAHEKIKRTNNTASELQPTLLTLADKSP